MADDDLETGRPRESGRLAPGRSPLGPSQAITLFVSLMLVGMLVCTSIPGAESVRMLALDRPIESVERVFERNLGVEEAIESLPSWSHSVARVLAGSTMPARDDAITAFEVVLSKRGYPRPEIGGGETAVDPALLDGLRARRAFLLADIDRVEEAQGDLQRLSSVGHQAFVDGLRRATSKVKSDDVRAFEAYDSSLAGEDWIGTRLRWRLASAVGDSARADDIERSIHARRDAVARRVVFVAFAKGLLLTLGLGLLFAWLARNRPATIVSSADIPPAWTFESGYAVCIRSAFAALLVMLAIDQIDAWLDRDLLRLWGALLVSLPMLWLVRRRLLRPLGTTFGSAFGLSSVARPTSWIGITLAVFALDWLGSRVIVDALHAGGLHSDWSESVDPIAVWASRPIALLNAFGDCVWAPIVTELGLRGLLFLTLRRHYGAWQSALFSSLLFGVAHFYSLPALAQVTWQGFVFAMAFERTKSLVPCIASHMIASLIAAATTWVFWR